MPCFTMGTGLSIREMPRLPVGGHVLSCGAVLPQKARKVLFCGIMLLPDWQRLPLMGSFLKEECFGKIFEQAFLA